MQFSYRAKQNRDTLASGVIDAVDLTAAVTHLKRMGLFPLEVVPLETSEVSSRVFSIPRTLPRMTVALWARTIGQGLAAGLSLTQALHLLAEQESGRPLGAVTKTLEEEVTGGMSLAQAMARMGAGFSPVAISLVRAGETSGALEQVFQALAERMEAEADLIGKVRGALVYPLFVLTVGFGTVAVLLWVVVPKLGLLFSETGQPLPWLTRFMIHSGQGLVWALGGLLVVILLAVLGSQRGWWKIPIGSWLAKILSRLPLFGRLITQAEVARLSSTLGLLLAHGLPLPESLRLVAETLGQRQMKEQILQSHHQVMEGVSLSTSFRKVGIREPFLLTMMAMGEAQGDLARAFDQAGRRYHEDVDRQVKALSVLIEPIMILLVGGIVGAIVFSMLLPIFQLNFTVGS